MIKIVEIKGGLQELQKLQKRRDFPFDKQQSLWEKESGPSLSEQFRSYQDFQEALSEEISSESDRIIAEERRRETVRTLQQMQNMPLILGTGGENEYVAGVDPYLDMTPLTPHSAYFQNSPRQRDPDTGNIEVLQSDGNSITFSRDMTEEQMIAYFDSLN